MNKGGKTELTATMFNSVTGEKIFGDSNSYHAKYIPLSFRMIPYQKPSWPLVMRSVDGSFFGSLGISASLSIGKISFINTKKLTRIPLMDWYENVYYSDSTGLTTNDLKTDFPAFLFRGYLQKLEESNPMYLEIGTKNTDDAENYL